SDVRLLTLARDAFFRIVREDSSATILNNIFSIMAARLRKADETIGSLVFLDVCGRVARILIELAGREGRKGRDGFIKMESPTHQTIASQIGASREAVTKAIKSLASNGLIRIEGREVIISQRQFELL
ncbi:MAG: Crp/Fnr family transcriptional regulator, partial [Deltaproteobacteria bacterium]|nr:Crp/Fnr family transcriptional regulator [Deltaproteobacteria bacterium]